MCGGNVTSCSQRPGCGGARLVREPGTTRMVRALWPSYQDYRLPSGEETRQALLHEVGRGGWGVLANIQTLPPPQWRGEPPSAPAPGRSGWLGTSDYHPSRANPGVDALHSSG